MTRAVLPVVVAAALFASSPCGAASANAHYHYQIGARASAALGFARQLHFVAAGEGAFLPDLAAVNAADLERLAQEIGHWVDAAEAAGDEDGETARIRSDLGRMRQSAADAAAVAGALRTRLADVVAAGAEPDEGVRTAVAEDARRLYAGFQDVLRAHKRAETELGIPVPDDPPSR